MSQIIPLGIGTPAGIDQLVLTGLSPGVLPPPPTPGGNTGQFKIISGDAAYSFDLFSSLIFTDGIEFTLPGRLVEITWQTIFQSVPAVVSIALQLSVDGFTWYSADTTTNVSGEVRTLITAAGFVRAAMLDMSEGIITSVAIVVKAVDYQD